MSTKACDKCGSTIKVYSDGICHTCAKRMWENGTVEEVVPAQTTFCGKPFEEYARERRELLTY